MTQEERTTIKDGIDAINERLEDIRVEYDKANDDEECICKWSGLWSIRQL